MSNEQRKAVKILMRVGDRVALSPHEEFIRRRCLSLIGTLLWTRLAIDVAHDREFWDMRERLSNADAFRAQDGPLMEMV